MKLLEAIRETSDGLKSYPDRQALNQIADAVESLPVGVLKELDKCLTSSKKGGLGRSPGSSHPSSGL